jgi:hypothetical protein
MTRISRRRGEEVGLEGGNEKVGGQDEGQEGGGECEDVQDEGQDGRGMSERREGGMG